MSVKWVKVEQVKIKNRTYYFYNNTINIEEFNSSLLKIDKKIVQRYTYIYYIGYITSKNIGDCENIYSLNPLSLITGKAIGHIEENNGNKYLVFDTIDEIKKYLKSTENFGMGLKMILKQ